MARIARAYDAAIVALAAIAGVILAASFPLIVYDVILRNALLISPPAFSVPSIEYGLLYMTMFAGPWLVRVRGHVVVEALRLALPPRARVWLERLVYVICILVCAVLTWKACELTVEAFVTGEHDPRAIEVPYTVRYAPFVIGFFLMGCEFARYLFGRGSFYGDATAGRESV